MGAIWLSWSPHSIPRIASRGIPKTIAMMSTMNVELRLEDAGSNRHATSRATEPDRTTELPLWG